LSAPFAAGHVTPPNDAVDAMPFYRRPRLFVAVVMPPVDSLYADAYSMLSFVIFA